MREPKTSGLAAILVSRRHLELLYQVSTREWLPLADVGGDLDTARKEILRLRTKLAKFLGLHANQVLMTDGRKRYRLIVRAELDRRAIRKHLPDLATSPPGAG